MHRPRADSAAVTTHRAVVTACDPGLPQRTGRAIKQLRADVEQLQTVMVTIASAYAGCKKRRERGPVTVNAVVKPQVDPDDMSRALVKIMRGIQRHYEQGSATER